MKEVYKCDGFLSLTQKLVDNINGLLKAIEDNKPTWVKGKLVKKVVLSTTMSPAVVIAY